jgi:drug/metabolite transporter (DMT)-like permease
MAAQAAGASGICFAAAALFAPRNPWHWSGVASQCLGLFIFDLPALFLLFWLMRRLAASRLTARFLLAPLITVLAGMALEVPALSTRAWFGIALLAGGAGWLVFAPAERNDVEGLNLRNALTADSPRRLPPDG